MQYRTKEGDSVDAVCWKFYGYTDGATEAVYAANPKLADKGPLLPAGLILVLPELEKPQKSEGLNLWD